MKLNKILPFLEDADKCELVNSILNNEILEGKISIMEVVPFLKEEDVDRLFKASLAHAIEVNPISFLPFLSKDEISKLLEGIKSGEYTNFTLEEILPFLEEDQIKALFKETLHSIKKSKQE
jgi:hypothetical protein